MRHCALGAILIAINVGINYGREVDILELSSEFYRSEGSRFGPPFDNDTSAPGVDADDDGTGEGCGSGLDEMRIFHGSRCDDDSACTGFHPTMHFFHRPDSAADLHQAAGGLDDLSDDGRVLTVVEHGIEIDDMQPLCALCR